MVAALAPALVVKNTFICAVGVDEYSPCVVRRRARTHEVSSSTLLLDSDKATALESEDRRADLAMALEMGGDEASTAISEIRDCLPALSFHPEGSSLVQRSLEVADLEEQKAIAMELTGNVCEAAKTVHARKVLEKVVACLGFKGAVSVAEELLQLGGREVASNAYACHLFCCLVEHAPTVPSVVVLVDQALSDDPADLCCQKFGHLVAATVVAHGMSRQAAAIAFALRSNPQRFGRHRFASKVYEAALRTCPAVLCEGLARDLMDQPGAVASMACHNFGVNVVRALVELPAPVGYAWQARQYLCRASKRVCKDKYGLALMSELGLAKVDAITSVAQARSQVGGA